MVPCTQWFYLNLFPVFGFLNYLTVLNEPDKPVTSVFLILQRRKSYKPSKNGPICALAYLLCTQRFYRLPVFDGTFVQTLIAPCIADHSGTEVLCDIFIANAILQRAQKFYLDSTFVHYNIWLYKYLKRQWVIWHSIEIRSFSAQRFYLALLKVTRFYQ